MSSRSTAVIVIALSLAAGGLPGPSIDATWPNDLHRPARAASTRCRAVTPGT